MASKGIVNRDQHRKDLNAQYSVRRRALKEQLRESWQNPQRVADLYAELRKIPLNSSPTRLHNRDVINGRPRGYIRKFGLSRITFREMAHRGLLPGVIKSSW